MKNYSIVRHPRTTQERKLSGRRGFIYEDGYKIKIRPKRNSKNLPNPYGYDQFIRKPKSWKKLRKTKYKPIKEGQ